MPTPIIHGSYDRKGHKKTDHADLIREVVNDHMLTKLAASEMFSYEDAVGTLWSSKDIELVKKALSMSCPVGINNAVFAGSVTIEHPALPELFHHQINFRLVPPTKGSCYVWPKEWNSPEKYVLRHDANPTMYAAMYSIAEAAINRGLLRMVTNWLLYNCKTHEQAAWMLPAWATICRRHIHLRQIGQAISDVEKPRTLPPVPPAMRKMLKFMHMFLAGHELMGTFDNDWPVRNHQELCGLHLDGEQDCRMYMGEIPVEVTLI